MCMCVCMYVCLYVCMYACMYVCMHIHIYTHIQTYIHTHTHTHTHTGTPVDVRSSRRGRTPLHDAAAQGQTHTCETLLSLGANIHARYAGLPPKIRQPVAASADSTALHDAADNAFTHTCLALLKAGASLHALDADGYSPLNRALCRSIEGDPHCPYAEVIVALQAWENGTIGHADVPDTDNNTIIMNSYVPPTDSFGMHHRHRDGRDTYGLRAKLHSCAGREVRGDGGDLMKWDAPRNYNGVMPPTRADDYQKDFKDVGAWYVERDMDTYRRAYAGLRRPGFVNPGHTKNSGQMREPMDDMLARALMHMLMRRKQRVPEGYRQRRRARMWEESRHPSDEDDDDDGGGDGDRGDEADPSRAKKLGFFAREFGMTAMGTD